MMMMIHDGDDDDGDGDGNEDGDHDMNHIQHMDCRHHTCKVHVQHKITSSAFLKLPQTDTNCTSQLNSCRCFRNSALRASSVKGSCTSSGSFCASHLSVKNNCFDLTWARKSKSGMPSNP